MSGIAETRTQAMINPIRMSGIPLDSAGGRSSADGVSTDPVRPDLTPPGASDGAIVERLVGLGIVAGAGLLAAGAALLLHRDPLRFGVSAAVLTGATMVLAGCGATGTGAPGPPSPSENTIEGMTRAIDRAFASESYENQALEAAVASGRGYGDLSQMLSGLAAGFSFDATTLEAFHVALASSYSGAESAMIARTADRAVRGESNAVLLMREAQRSHRAADDIIAIIEGAGRAHSFDSTVLEAVRIGVDGHRTGVDAARLNAATDRAFTGETIALRALRLVHASGHSTDKLVEMLTAVGSHYSFDSQTFDALATLVRSTPLPVDPTYPTGPDHPPTDPAYPGGDTSPGDTSPSHPAIGSMAPQGSAPGGGSPGDD